MKKKQEEKHDECVLRDNMVLPQPPELQTEFVKDLVSILERVEDKTDKIMFEASKDLTEIYLRTPMTPEEFEKMRIALKQVYSNHKMDDGNKGSNEELLERVDAYLDHVAELRNKINSATNSYIQ